MLPPLDRETLKARGWCQGAILEGKDLPTAYAAPYYLVLTQDCDCINPDAEKEPRLELLPLTPSAEQSKRNPETRDGINPREIQFRVKIKGAQTLVDASIASITFLSRTDQISTRPALDVTVSREALQDLLVWRAARYLRTAFPDSFENAFRGVRSKFSRAIKAVDSLIDSIHIKIDPWEPALDEPYEIQLVLVILPAIHAIPANLTKLEAAREKIVALMDKSPRFEGTRCKIVSAAKISVWEINQFKDFTRYDYLSFGEGTAI